MIIAPSILNANNLQLGNDIKKASEAGITRFHIDIMDGHFVPNLSYGPQLVKDFKREFPMTDAEIHLMSDNPKDLIPAFVQAGADLLEFHYEAMDEGQVSYWLDYLASNGVRPGLVLNPDTPVSVLDKFAPKLKQVLLMTVYPGFGGQKFIEASIDRIKEARKIIDQTGSRITLEVDGGINADTIKLAKDAGANVFVVGSYLFKDGDVAGKVNKLNEILA
ncbi:ribulose-phosphate 3-epimerase [Lactobacillus pasteurii DSM 23907 = CRBIP 24.76]|uniref:Ribulose-phosphate 3-epimerase n=1 Tax=Lactobacillus pasteurii DSM 23907 = CRBIP 24.76 TaxID=1423790 RepID=I7LBM8_9LACO|nr:ribulose-phosphate 3-epimerase [Lactobacillus pasteurii]KRK08407.1 ribulose-phosphate 3-epimerase [Lactobacillus pasteurii DSM 23907 = CRBIP 24.76]TDG75585.1 hypothetical protein C5L33_000470 [Lactobacillus pasteurii]CCI85736.1 Ribulose-phosphate 3-epimerase [Lactobacillus pasteurii DSM 23907 = CRBIP 24.76]